MAAPAEIIRGGRARVFGVAVDPCGIGEVRWLIHEMVIPIFTACHPELKEVSKVVPASTFELHADDSVSKHTPILDEPPAPPFACKS